MKMVKIYSTGSCDAATREGSAEVVLECEGKIKYLTFSYSDTTANRCILQGLIDGVNCLKKPCNVELISSCELGVKKAQKGKGVNVDLHKELCGVLIKKECEYSFSVMHGEGDILNAFIRKHRTKQ